jgi:hypothetical protein
MHAGYRDTAQSRNDAERKPFFFKEKAKNFWKFKKRCGYAYVARTVVRIDLSRSPACSVA